jgi:hypothetical protein
MVNKIIESLPKGEALLKKTIALSEAVLKTTGNEGKDNINQEIKQLQIEWENLQQICRDTKKLLEKCLCAWSDYLETSDKMGKWVKDFDNKLKGVQKVDKITPEHLEKCRVSIIASLYVIIFITFFDGRRSSDLRSIPRNQRSRARIPVVRRGFCDEELDLLTGHGCLYILLSI